MTSNHRTIVHMDMDCFFVSVSRLINPKLNNMPVIVGGGERGVVAACSYETRKFGVHSAMPIKQAKRLCPDAIIIRGDYDEYSKRSDEVTQIIKEDVPLYERSSIDEFYIDLSGMDKFFGCFKHATELRMKIMKETGLPISLGMSANKTVSKVATDEAKPNNYRKVDYGEEKNFLAPLSVKKIPMIGEKTYHLLRSMGIELVKTLQEMPAELMQNVLGENGISIWRKANGIDNAPVEPYTEQKSMSQEETFETDTIDVEKMKHILLAMSEKLCFRLRADVKLAGCVTVKIRYSNFDTHIMQCRIPYTSHDHVIIERVKELFEKVYDRRMLIRLVGVKLSHLVGGRQQIDLFDDKEEMIKLYQAMDKMRIIYGEHTVHRAVAMNSSLRSFNPFNGISSSPDKDGKLSDGEYEYLLVINPSQHVTREVIDIKKYFSLRYDFPVARKLHPHITLARFDIDESKENELLNLIESVCLHQLPCEIQLNNFDFFPHHTLFIGIKQSSALTDFVKSLKEKSSFPKSRSFFSFRPHMTVARGLTQEKFLKAKEEYENKEYTNSFNAAGIALLKRKDQYDKFIVLKEFEFHDTRSVAVV